MSSATSVVSGDNIMVTVRQRALPLPWRRAPSPDATVFVHPAERELARILTFHQVRWVYEPTTFVLERDAAGSPTICFNPDFYLPDHHRYLELTTMRQAHVTRKNRKMRLLRERYPSVDVQLLYRRDFERLVDRCRAEAAPDSLVVGSDRFSADDIARRVDEVAASLVGTANRLGAIVTVGRGADRFAAELASALRRRGAGLHVGRLVLAGGDVESSARQLRVHRAPEVALDRRVVLIVTDVVSSGLTADFAARWLRARGAAGVEVVTLLDRPLARIFRPPVRAAAFTLEEEVVAGHGLAIGGRFGELDDIVEVHRPRAVERPASRLELHPAL